MPGETGHVRDAGVRDDQLAVRVPLDEPGEVVRDRRQATAAVDQDRDVPRLGQREHGCEQLVGEHELLRPRVELDPARAEVDAAFGLADRVRPGEVEADERDEAPPASWA